MDSFVRRVLSLSAEEVTLLREDANVLSHMQQANRLIETVLTRRQSPNASNTFDNSDTYYLAFQQRQPGHQAITHQENNNNNNNTSSNNNNNNNTSSNNNNNNNLTDALDLTTHRPMAASVAATNQKRHPKDFDEPDLNEIETRMRVLVRHDSYHIVKSSGGECACVLGSEFANRTVASVLEMVEQWRQMDTEQRLAYKWDMSDLPKDIPLVDINKFENLRREASNGRANFGGVSRRKPLGIRGTRQFLLILYCLWGHPGREDEMQRDGYCPHCFARIKKANDQSILVRVVNHFNMKHKRGANPRLHTIIH